MSLRGTGVSGVASITGGNAAFFVRITLPLLRSPTGTMGNNGAFTSGTAFGKVYPKGWMYFAANQIAAGVAAGWYFFTSSSTTVFTIFNNTYTSGANPAPGTPTAFVTTGPGATTGDTTEQGALFVVAANQLGSMGGFRIRARFSNNNTVGTKTHRLRYSGVAGTQLQGQAETTTTAAFLENTTFNQGATNAQESGGTMTNGTAVGSQFVSTTQDTTAASNPAITTVIGTATDYAVIEWALIEYFTDGT